MDSREESHNPALAEEEFEPVEKNYRVIAKTKVMDHDTGEVFTATLNQMEVDSLVGSHLEVVDDQKGTEDSGTADTNREEK